MRTLAYVLILIASLAPLACSDDDGGANNQNNNATGDGGTGSCGDGVRQGTEECDDGPLNSDSVADACRTDCRAARCGDRVIDTGEQCDDGAANNDDLPDACRTSCTSPHCGDRVVDVLAGETCDCGSDPGALRPGCPGVNGAAGSPCSDACQVRYCGNGVQDPDEACDDGNWISGDGCSADCRSMEVCGNGYVDVARNEYCDDGNPRSHDGCSSGCTIEAPTWTQWTGQLTGRRYPAYAYDSGRQRLVIFGGVDSLSAPLSDTWEYDGSTWKRICTPTVPRARTRTALAYDASRGRVVMFGGIYGSQKLDDTWEYDGFDWTRRTTAHSPSARSVHMMAYDAALGAVVLFGGRPGSTVSAETWWYDGTDWTLTTPTASPPGMGEAGAMTYDPDAEVLVLFGVDSGGQPATWEYEGTTWSQVSSSSTPWMREGHSLAYDSVRGVVVLYGGFNGPNCDCFLEDTWEWNGSSWTQRTPTTFPGPRTEYAMVFHGGRGRTVLFGGYHCGGQPCSETWEYDGTNWQSVVSTPLVPTMRRNTAMAFDPSRGRTVLFGGADSLADTWEFDGERWEKIRTLVFPSARNHHAMAYDPVGMRILMFGGYVVGGPTQETWAYDENGWTLLSPGTSPSARATHGMVTDTGRSVVVLNGGISGETDTWEFDGTDWREVSTTASPPVYSRFAYDADRGVVVAFGGDSTWEYSGTDWAQVTVGQSPGDRLGHHMVYSSLTRRVLMMGGTLSGFYLDDVWSYDGSSWVELPTALSPPGRAFGAAAFDELRGLVLLAFGDYGDYDFYKDDTWIFRFSSAYPEEHCGNGQDDDADALVDCADPDCEGRPCGPSLACLAGSCQ